MTTGVTIYLVSACSSAEEFVAAFRRYVDRTGVFVPIAEPFGVGRRAHMALTLADGGVMIEGNAEVVAAATRPSALHGRVGMTIRFVDPDEPSKLVLADIEKSRLVVKPASAAIAPRPATLPDGPRPTPPPVGGRIDAANALAECVALGDLKPSVPVVVAEVGSGGTGPTKAGSKFVMPSIPSSPSGPTSSSESRTPTTLGAAPLDRAKGPSQQIPIVGRRDPRLPLPPRIVPNAAGTPPTAVPNVGSQRIPRATSEPPKTDDVITRPEPAVGRTPTPRAPAEARPPTPARPPSPAPAAPPTPGPVPVVGRTPTPTTEPELVLARVHTPTTVGPPPNPDARPESTAAPSSDAATAPPVDEASPIAQSRTATRLAAAPPAPVVASTSVGSPSPAPTTPTPSTTATPTSPTTPAQIGTPVSPMVALVYVPPDDSGPIVATPAPASIAAGLPTVQSIPWFEIVSTEAPTEPLLGRAETIRGVKPVNMPTFATRSSVQPGRANQSTPPPIPVAGATRPMGSPVAPSTVSIPTMIDPEDVEIADPTDLTEIPIITERKTSLGLGAIGPDDGLGPVGDTTVMPAEKRPDAIGSVEVDALAPTLSPDQASPLDVEPAGDWTMKPDAATPTPLVPVVAGVRGQPSGDWTITPEPDSPDGWSAPGTVKRPPGPPKSVVASEVPLDSKRRPEPTITTDEPKVQIDPTLIGPLPDLSDRAAASGSMPMAAAGPVAQPMAVVEAPSMQAYVYPTPAPGSVVAPVYPTPAPGSVVAPMYPTPYGQPYPTGGMTASPQPYPTGGMTASPLPYPTGVVTASPQPFPTDGVTAPPTDSVTLSPQPFPTGVINPNPHPSGTGPAMAIPGPEQQMAMLGFPAQQLVVQQSGTSGFFPYATDSSPRLTRAPRRRTRIAVIAISAALVVAAGVVLLIVLAGNNDSDPTTDLVAIEPPDDHAVTPGDPSGVTPGDSHVKQPGDAPSDAGVTPAIQPVVDAAVVAPAKCFVDLTSSPDDAEIVVDRDHIAGRTPLKLELPCDADAKLRVRKHGYFTVAKTVTPTADAPAIKFELAKAAYQLRVSSSPAGATITVNGRSGGVTPASVKVTAYEPTTIVLTKDGFSTETEKLTPKTDNQTVHITLKRKKLLR